MTTFKTAIVAEDGTHRRTFKSAKGAKAFMDRQLGRPIEQQHEFIYNNGDGNYKPLDFALWCATGTYLSFTDDWGRRISIERKQDGSTEEEAF